LASIGKKSKFPLNKNKFSSANLKKMTHGKSKNAEKSINLELDVKSYGTITNQTPGLMKDLFSHGYMRKSLE
jgi:hypothetical protein